MVIPEWCIPEIQAQRTQFRDLDDPRDAWRESIEADAQQIEPWLPRGTGAALDIGCGLAGIDIWLYHRGPGWEQGLERFRRARAEYPELKFELWGITQEG